MTVSSEIKIAFLLFLLFILPRILLRFHLPTSITVFILGLILGSQIDLINEIPIIQTLSTIGIASLFLFAGLEVNFKELRQQKRILIEHVTIRTLMIGFVSYLFHRLFHIDLRTSSLVSLAVLSPSAGFILDQLSSSRQTENQKTWIRNLAIAAELIAMVLMFVLLKVENAKNLISSTTILLLLILALPLIFNAFIKYIIPIAPNSEFSFLLILSILAALITKKIGIYYLIGAFVVGLTAQFFYNNIPKFSSKNMIDTLRQFATFFMPFYFFYAGTKIPLTLFELNSILTGIAMIIFLGSLRLSVILLHRKISLKESFQDSLPIATSLLPNLVFGLVLTQILISENNIPSILSGALIVYCIGITLIPTLIWLFTGRNIPTNEV